MPVKSPIYTLQTHDIRVSIRPNYMPQYSTPERSHFVFSYNVLIENNSPVKVQLLSRRWYVVDALGENQYVEGAGVIGKQPTLPPGETFEYVSGAKLSSDIGKMYGQYLMQRPENGRRFWIDIPEFPLVVSDRWQ